MITVRRQLQFIFANCPGKLEIIASMDADRKLKKLLDTDYTKPGIDKFTPIAEKLDAYLPLLIVNMAERRCRICGCTEQDCSQCIEKTGEPCHWVEKDLCSACR